MDLWVVCFLLYFSLHLFTTPWSQGIVYPSLDPARKWHSSYIHWKHWPLVHCFWCCWIISIYFHRPTERCTWLHIILHAKKSLLYDSGDSWGKQASSNLFDVTMGSYDGGETCELVGAFLLHNIRDDGLGISNASPHHRLVRSSTSMALRAQLNPTKKSWISLTWPLTCLTARTWRTLNPTTSHFTSTISPTIHRRSLKTSHYPSTKASLRSHMMKHPSTKLRRFTRKPLMRADNKHCLKFSTPSA